MKQAKYIKYKNATEVQLNNRRVKISKHTNGILLQFTRLHDEKIEPFSYTRVVRDKIHITEVPLTYEAAHALMESLKEILKVDMETIKRDSTSNSIMYKAVFSFKKYDPQGGFGEWTEEIVPIEATSDIELKEKIEIYQKNDHYGYHKYIQLKSLDRM